MELTVEAFCITFSSTSYGYYNPNTDNYFFVDSWRDLSYSIFILSKKCYAPGVFITNNTAVMKTANQVRVQNTGI